MIKNIFQNILLLLFPLLLVTGSLESGTAKKQIEILLSSDSELYLEGLGGIQSVLKVPARVRYLHILLANQTDMKEYFEEVEKEHLALYISVGLKASRLAEKYLRNTPLLFSHINFPRNLLGRKKNICGFTLNISVKYSFKILKEINPNLKNIYAFYSTQPGKILAYEGYAYDLQNHLIYNAVKVKKSGFASTLNSLRNKMQAVYIIPDLLYNKENFRLLSKFCRKNKIILIAPFRGLIRAGAVFGFIANPSGIGLRAGALANSILSGKKECSSQVYFPGQRLFFLNEKYARSAGISIPSSIKQKDKRMRLFYIALHLKNKKKYKSALAIFKKLKQDDPADKESLEMIRQIINITTRDKTKSLEFLASKEKKLFHYPAAIIYYKKILRINPGSTRIKKLLLNTTIEYSNSYVKKAEAAVKKRSFFEAIVHYKRALEIYGNNSKARKALLLLRANLKKMLPEIKNGALSKYNSRDYAGAILLLNRYLLIKPGDKIILEYLRMSKRKEIAIQKLREMQQ